MALAPRDVSVTREQVVDWLEEYKGLETKPEIKYFLAAKINALLLEDHMVNTTEHEDLDNETSLLDMLMMDLPSYGYEV